MENTVISFPLEKTDNIINLKIINGKLNKKREVKYNKDGSICRISNHKQKGRSSEVYGFRTNDEINSMIETLNNHIISAQNFNQFQIANRNRLLFVVGVGVGLRASDLKDLKWSFFLNEDGSFKDYDSLQPKKQRKQKKFVKVFSNHLVEKEIRDYISMFPVEDYDSYLFVSRKGNSPLGINSICRIIKETAEEAGIKQNIGSHSLRKTFGFWVYHLAEDKKEAVVKLQEIFKHSSDITTRKYIGILDDEIRIMYDSISKIEAFSNLLSREELLAL